ncbi:MAG TPA: hypothetical protein VGO80_10145 [Solirubrobacteraceae bacterium]|jgi:hypothetical protein|nr:hypothetical protein [Solirubrobacteraceae bacterium]
MIEAFASLVVLATAVVWGVMARPGRPFSWTMFSGSSKAFLWLCEQPPGRSATTDDLHLTPDSHYLLERDLQRLAEARSLPALDGLIVGSLGSWTVTCDGEGGLRTEPVDPDDELVQLALALRRACPQR